MKFRKYTPVIPQKNAASCADIGAIHIFSEWKDTGSAGHKIVID